MRRFRWLPLAAALWLAGCTASHPAAPAATAPPATPPAATLPAVTPTPSAVAATPAPSADTTPEEDSMQIQLTVQDTAFTATLAETQAAEALAETLREAPLTLSLSDYAGFEKVGPLGFSLPASDRQTTTRPGDIVLYQGDQIVLFYGTNAWRYTRLARVDDLTGWAEALGSGTVSVTLSLPG